MTDVAGKDYKVCMPDCHDPNCKTCKDKKETCTACTANYTEFVTIPGSGLKICMKKGMCLDTNCKTCKKDRFVCEACKDGYYHIIIPG